MAGPFFRVKQDAGDQIYSKSAAALRSEILCLCIAYNLTRLVYLELEQGIEADFTGGVEVLRRAPWCTWGNGTRSIAGV